MAIFMVLLFLVVLLIAPVFFLIKLQKPPSSHLSLRHMAEIVKRSFDSFSCVYVVTFLSAAVSLASIWIPEFHKDLYQIHTTLQLGVSVAFAFYAFGVSPEKKKIIPLVVIGLLAIVYFLQRDQPTSVMVLRWAQLFLLSHLLISFAPHVHSGSAVSFWSYNKNLLFTFLVSTIYSVVILVGIMIALGAIHFLFEVQRSDFFKLYPSMAALCAFIIHPTIFLGIVESKQIVKGKDDQGDLAPLRTFSTYVLYPLLFLYLVILLGYESKIMYAMALPKGTVSWLVCSFGVAGVLTWLLTYPLGQEGKGASVFFHKRFFNLFLPLLGLIAVGVWERVESYGVTESRYFLIVLTAWISIITVGFSFRPHTSIKVIPISLFVLILPTTFGYFSAYSTSYRSQFSRLERSIFKDGECRMFPNGTFSPDEQRNIVSIIDYLFVNHPAATRASLGDRCKNDTNISDAIRKIERTDRPMYYSSQERRFLLVAFGVALNEQYQNTTPSVTYFSYSSTKKGETYAWNVEGLTELFSESSVYGATRGKPIMLFLKNNETVSISLEKTVLRFAFSTGEVLAQDFRSRLGSLEEQYKDSQFGARVKEADLDFVVTDKGKTVKLFISHLRGQKSDSGYEIDLAMGAFGFNVGGTQANNQTTGVQ